MTAQEAREIREKNLIPNMETIFADIKKAAGNGESSITLYLTDMQKKLANTIVANLQKLGYIASTHDGYDQRDNSSWITLIVSW